MIFLVPTDGSVASRRAVARGEFLARASGAELRIFPVVGPAVAAAVRRRAEAEGADLIVVAQQAQWGGRLRLLGSVADEIAHQAPCSVLVERGGKPGADDTRPLAPGGPEIRSILVGLDFSDASRDALALAARLGGPLGAQLYLLHVLPPVRPGAAAAAPTPGAGTGLDEALARLEDCTARCRSSRIRVEPHLRRGTAARVIARVAGELASDLVVLGARGRTGKPDALLGRVAGDLLWRAPCPVLLVRDPSRARTRWDAQADPRDHRRAVTGSELMIDGGYTAR